MINRERPAYSVPTKQDPNPDVNTYFQTPATKNSSLSKMIIVGTLTALIYLLPWVFTIWTEEYYEITKNYLLLVGIAVLVMVWGVTTIIKKRVSLFKTPIDLAVLIMLVVAVLATIFSINKDTSIWGYHMRMTGGLVSYILLAAIYYLVINNINSKATVKFLLRSTVYSLALIALFTILKSLGILDALIKPIADAHPTAAFLRSPLFTPIGNPNSLAYLFVVGLPLSLFMFVNKKVSTARDTLIGLITSVLFITAAALTSLTDLTDISRIVTWLIIIAIVIAAIIFSYRQQSKSVQGRIWMNLALLVVVVMGALFTFDSNMRQGVNNTLTKMNLTYNFSRYYDIPANTSVQVITGEYSKYGASSVLIGTGLDTYAYVFPQFRPLEQNLQVNWFENYTRSNTQIEAMLTSMGLVGGLLTFGALAFLIGKFVWTKVIKNKEAMQKRSLIAVSMVMVLFLLSFFLIYQSITLLFFFWVLMALGFKLYYADFPDDASRLEAQFRLVNRTEPNKSVSLAPYIFTGAMVIGAFIMIVFVTVNYLAEVNYSLGLKQASANNYDNAYDYYVKAVNDNGNRDYYHREIASVALSNLDAMLSANTDQTKLTDAQKTQQETAANYLLTLINAEVNKSILLNPENHENWQRAAVIYKRLTELAQGKQFGNETLQAITQAITRNPNNPDNYLLLGYIYQFNADSTLRVDAEQAYLKAYDLQPSYALSIIQLGGYLEYVNKYSDALSLYTVSKEKIFTTDSAMSQFLQQRIDAMNAKIAQNGTATPTPTSVPTK